MQEQTSAKSGGVAERLEAIEKQQEDIKQQLRTIEHALFGDERLGLEPLRKMILANTAQITILINWTKWAKAIVVALSLSGGASALNIIADLLQ